jgi:glucokinase
MTACIRQTSPTLPWRSFDVRRALEDRLQLPVIYNNDGSAAALYAHHMHFRIGGQ